MARRRHRGCSKETADLLAQCEAQGCEIDHQRRHIQVKVPGGGIVTLPSTPSDHRSIANSRAQLRRAGVQI